MWTKTALLASILAVAAMLANCSKQSTKPAPVAPSVLIAVTIDSLVPNNVSVDYRVSVDGSQPPDSVLLLVDGNVDGRITPSEVPREFRAQHVFSDTLLHTVAAQAYLSGAVCAAESTTTRSRAHRLTVAAIPSAGRVPLATLLRATLEPAELFRTLRIQSGGLDTSLTVPAGSGSHAVFFSHTFASPGVFAVQGVGGLKSSAASDMAFDTVRAAAGLWAALRVTPDSGRAPLVTTAIISMARDTAIERVEYDYEGDGVMDSVIAQPGDSIALIHTYSAGTFAPQLRLVAHDTTIMLTQQVGAWDAVHYHAGLSLEPDSGRAPMRCTATLTIEPDTLIQSIRYDFEGDGVPDTSLAGNMPIVFTHSYSSAANPTALITTRDSVITLTLHVTVWPDYVAQLTITPDSGAAPLITSAAITISPATGVDTIAYDFEGDGREDTVVVWPVGGVVTLPFTYRIGTCQPGLRIVAVDTVIALTGRVLAVNTPPDMNLPTATAYEDSSMQQVNLDDYTSNLQSPDSLLQFVIVSQWGSGVASLQNHILSFTLPPDGNGPGCVTIRVNDPDGGVTTRNLNYSVLPMTDLRIHLADLETLNPLQDGIVNINGHDYYFNGSADVQVLPGGIVPVRAVHTLNNVVQSFERTADLNTSADRDTTILVSTYDALQEQGISPFRYRTFLWKARNKPVPSNPSHYGLAKINFTHASQGFDNNGYTWWIGKTNPNNGLQWTDQEQLQQENIILTEINANIIHPWARPNSHRATLQDSSYYIDGYGTTRNGLLPSYKTNLSSNIITYDRNFDGVIESVFIEIHQFQLQGDIVQENLSALAFPNEVGIVDSTLTPNETVLHRQSQISTMSRADIHALNEAINLPAAEELDRVYHIR